MNARLLLALTLLAATAPLQAAVYQCTDANGKTAYQGQPCAQSVAKQVVLEKSSAPTATTQKKTVTGENYYERDQFVGTWCFFEQMQSGVQSQRSATIQLDDKGHYIWSEGQSKKEGRWGYDNTEQTLELENIGSYELGSARWDLLLLVPRIQPEGYRVMSWRTGSC